MKKTQPEARLTSSLISQLSTLILAVCLGALTVLGFAPFYLFPLPVITLAALFYLWRRAHGSWPASALGWAFGMGFFGAGVSWVYVSMHDFGAMPAPLAALTTLVFCAYLALFPALAGFLQAVLPVTNGLRWSLLTSSLWMLLEWLRGWLFTGFPWLALGYSQAPASPLAGYAPLLGVYGVSLVTIMSAGLLILMVEDKKKFLLPSTLILAVIWLSGFGLKQIDWTRPAGEPVTVSLLQGNIPQSLKWREDRVASTLDTYLKLTLQSNGRLIILPETALPLFHDKVPQSYLARLAEHARTNNGDVLLGLPEFSNGGRSEYYNSVFSFGSAATQVYRKSHLVPFGEFIPLKPAFGWIINVLKIPLSDFSRGTETQQPLNVAGQQVAINVCYEDVFGEEIIRQLPQATLLANFSNDAWFGESIAIKQHLQISQMRALETGRYMLRATNTGVTAVINQRGQVLAQAPEFTTMALHHAVQGYSGATPYVRWGNAMVLGIAAAFAVVVLAFAHSSFRTFTSRVSRNPEKQ